MLNNNFQSRFTCPNSGLAEPLPFGNRRVNTKKKKTKTKTLRMSLQPHTQQSNNKFKRESLQNKTKMSVDFCLKF